MCVDDAIRRFRKEARVLAKIGTPHIVTIHYMNRRGGRLYFVMEYLPFSLDDLIEDYFGAPIPYEDASHILKQILEGLTAIHAENLVHRDVKPSNILMTGDHDVKVSDFGIVKDPAEGMTGPYALGTPGWMAPELRWGRQADPRSDVYSFGLVAYQMLTGYSPEDVESVEFSTCNVNPRFSDLLAICTSKDPSDRPVNANESALPSLGCRAIRAVRRVCVFLTAGEDDAHTEKDSVCAARTDDAGCTEYATGGCIKSGVRVSHFASQWTECSQD